MPKCEKCGVSVRGTLTRCPLCQGPLAPGGAPAEDIFPAPRPVRPTHRFWLRLLAFLSAALMILCAAANYLLPWEGMWSLFVGAGILSFWVSLSAVIRKRRNIAKTILWLVCLISAMAVLWDRFTGWRCWSLDYVVPILCLAAIAAMAVLGWVLGISLSDYLVYLMIGGFFGVIPLLFLLLGWVDAALPSVICVAASLLFLAGLGAFRGESMARELRRRFHL